MMSLDQSEGDVYKEQPSVVASVPSQSNGDAPAAEKPKRKVIHFADGSTMEDYDDDEDKQKANGDSVEGGVRSVQSPSNQSAPSSDPGKMHWPEWTRHYATKAGSKTLTVLEGMGGTAAYYLGITTPKYQSEIDEYNRMLAKKKSQEEELVSWSTGPKTQQQEPVCNDVRKNENGDIELTEKQ